MLKKKKKRRSSTRLDSTSYSDQRATVLKDTESDQLQRARGTMQGGANELPVIQFGASVCDGR